MNFEIHCSICTQSSFDDFFAIHAHIQVVMYLCIVTLTETVTTRDWGDTLG